MVKICAGIIIVAVLVLAIFIAIFIIYKKGSEKETIDTKTNIHELDESAETEDENNISFERFVKRQLRKHKDMNQIPVDVFFQVMVYLSDADNYQAHVSKIFKEAIQSGEAYKNRFFGNDDDALLSNAEGTVSLYSYLKKLYAFSCECDDGYDPSGYRWFRAGFKQHDSIRSYELGDFTIKGGDTYSFINFMVPHLCYVYKTLVYKQVKFLIVKIKVYPEFVENEDYNIQLVNHKVNSDLIRKGFEFVEKEKENIKPVLNLGYTAANYIENSKNLLTSINKCIGIIEKMKGYDHFIRFITYGPFYSAMRNNLCNGYFTKFKHQAFTDEYKKVLVKEYVKYKAEHEKYVVRESVVMSDLEEKRGLYKDLFEEEKKLGKFDDLVFYVERLGNYTDCGDFGGDMYKRFLNEVQLSLEYIKTTRKLYLLFITDILCSFMAEKKIAEITEGN